MSFGGGSGGSGSIATSSDVALSNPANSQVLAYNSTLAKWQNQPSPSGSSAWQFKPESYGGKGDGKVVADGAISAGGTTLTCATSAPFSSSDVGKTIVVKGAGPAVGGFTNGALTTTITGYTSSSVVTLGTASSASAITGAYVAFGTDDTAAIQATINAAAAYATAHNYYAEVVFQPHTYMVAGPLVQGGSTQGNAQLTLPVVPLSGNPSMTLSFIGTGNNAGVGMFTAMGDNPAPEWGGTVLMSTALGKVFDATYGGPSVLGGPTRQQGYGGGFTNAWNDLTVVVDGLTVMCPVAPTVSGIDLRTCIRAEIKWYRALVFASESSLGSWDPTPAGTIGLGMPQTGNNAHNYIGSYGCQGFGYGAILSEHTTFQEITAVLCGIGIYILGGGGHGITGLLYNAEANGTHVQSDGQPSSLNILSMSTEALKGGWGSGYYFDDPGNNLYGRIGLGGMMFSTITHNGANNLEIIADVDQKRGTQTAPTVPANGTAFANPFWRHATVYLTSGGAAVTGVAVNGTATGITLDTSGTAMVRVPSGATITLSYASTAPTWSWLLD